MGFARCSIPPRYGRTAMVPFQVRAIKVSDVNPYNKIVWMCGVPGPWIMPTDEAVLQWGSLQCQAWAKPQSRAAAGGHCTARQR